MRKDNCYYCGTGSLFVCDAFIDGKFCSRPVCMEHAIPEFEGGDVRNWSLCKEHWGMQVKATKREEKYSNG